MAPVLSNTGGSIAGDTSVTSLGNGTVTGEDSSIIYDLAKLEAMEKAAEVADDDLSNADDDLDDKELLLVITHLETHGLPVGDGQYKDLVETGSEIEYDGGDDDAARMKPSEIVAASRKRGGAAATAADDSVAATEEVDPRAPPQWSFPYVKAILGDQKAATNYFVTLPDPPTHEHEEKFLNQLHKHGIGKHGRKKRKDKEL